MERVDYLDGALTLPRLGAGHTIRHSPPSAAVLGRPASSRAPLCMSAAEYGEWQAANEQAGSFGAARPCDDCPLRWRLEQDAAGRCNG